MCNPPRSNLLRTRELSTAPVVLTHGSGNSAMTMRLRIALLLCLCLPGCADHPRPVVDGEPPGQAVTLTDEDQKRVRWAHDDMEAWAAWHTKGTRLLSPREGGGPEQQQQALYSFHQALAAWPTTLADSEPEDRRSKHMAEPSDTLLQIGFLYLKMNKPRFALAYFQRAQTYLPYSEIVTKGIADAEALLKAQP